MFNYNIKKFKIKKKILGSLKSEQRDNMNFIT